MLSKSRSALDARHKKLFTAIKHYIQKNRCEHSKNGTPLWQ